MSESRTRRSASLSCGLRLAVVLVRSPAAPTAVPIHRSRWTGSGAYRHVGQLPGAVVCRVRSSSPISGLRCWLLPGRAPCSLATTYVLAVASPEAAGSVLAIGLKSFGAKVSTGCRALFSAAGGWSGGRRLPAAGRVVPIFCLRRFDDFFVRAERETRVRWMPGTAQCRLAQTDHQSIVVACTSRQRLQNRPAFRQVQIAVAMLCGCRHSWRSCFCSSSTGSAPSPPDSPALANGQLAIRTAAARAEELLA